MHRHCLDFQAILRVGFTDLCCWTCLFSFLHSSSWHKKTEDYSIHSKKIFAGSSFLKLMELIHIFCFSCHVKYIEPNGTFKEDCFSFPNLNSCRGVLSPFISEFDLPPLKIVYSTCCPLSWTWMLVSVSSARPSSSSTLIAAPGA